MKFDAKVYREAHKEERNAYAKTRHREVYYEKIAPKERARMKLLRSQEMVIVAQIHGDATPRCRADLTPELLDLPCRGALQIDHINGNRIREFAQTRTYGVVDGSRNDIDDLRILCELHNYYYAILSKASRGGSLREDWEE